MRKALALVLTLAAVAAAWCQSAPSQGTLVPGDVVVVSVAGLPDYTTQTVILGDGTISGIGFDRVKIAGLTPSAARLAVYNVLRKRLKDPAVSLFLKEAAKRFVYVTSLERATAPVAFVEGMTVRQLVAVVSLPDDPDLLEARLSRPGKPVLQIDIPKLLAGSIEGDTQLLPGDTLSITRRAYVRVWVTGLVLKPGQIKVDQGSDVFQAIAAAGGQIRNAPGPTGSTLDNVDLQLLVRRGPKTIELPAKMNANVPPFALQEGDVVSLEAPGLLRLNVGGEVNRPGEFLLREGAGLEAVVAVAGGPKETGSLRTVAVVRGSEIFSVDASGAETGVGPSKFKLQSGDLVYVRRNEDFVYVMGEVMQPGRYIFADGEPMTAVDALAKAKGLRPTGTNRRVVHVSPDANGRYLAREFNLDEWLKDAKLSSNPKLKAGDFLFFTTPKGINPATVMQIASAAFSFDRIFRR